MRERTKAGRGIYPDRRLEAEPEDAAALEALDRGKPAAVRLPVPEDPGPTWRELAERVEARAAEILEEAGHEALVEAHRAAESNPRGRDALVADLWPPLPAEGLSSVALDAFEALGAVRELRRAHAGAAPEETDGPPAPPDLWQEPPADRLADAAAALGVLAERLGVRPWDALAARGLRDRDDTRRGGRATRDEALHERVRALAVRATQASQRSRAAWIARQLGEDRERVRHILRAHDL